ncbi:metal-dependent transcriptional regulator [candidate division KSB1 bacterium]|nr:metal-dependent transcriptional regulator [candidate division KSB1 bacterium]
MVQTWKKCNENELTHSGIHYLLAVHTLLERSGYARGIDVARLLDITRGSVSITISKLKSKGYIAEDMNKFYQLTEKGKEVVNSVLHKRRITDIFFKHVLQLPDSVAEADSCKIEHLLSKQTAAKLLSFVGYFLSDNNEATAFRKGFEKFYYKCQSGENCQICDMECFFAKHDMS